MATRRRRPRRTADQWQTLIEQQVASGQSQEAFCIAHDLGLSTFKRWKKRLESGPWAAESPATPTAALFAPLPAPKDSSDASGWTIELDLGDGVCLRLCRGGP